MIVLRHFQQQAVDACFQEMPHTVAQIQEVATGGGKTVIMAMTAKRILETWKEAKIILISHVAELIEQDSAMMEAVGLKVAIYADSLGRKETEGDVVCAMIQSVHRTDIFYDQDVLLLDEAHTTNHESGMYKNFIEKCKATNPNLRIIGYTATPYRLKGGSIVGENKLFNKISYQINTQQLQEMGWLKKLNFSVRSEGQVDVSQIQKVAGDFNLGQLGETYGAHDLVAYHAKLSTMIAKKRKTWLAFCVDIAHCELFAEELRALGITAQAIHSNLDNKTRAQRVEAFKRGELQCLTSVATLTTGFDTKIDGEKLVEIDCLISLRPTMSKTLWEQIKGRGTRPVFAEGLPLNTDEERLEAIAQSTHPNCLVVSFCGNPARFEDAVEKEKKKKNGEAPVKTCPACLNQIHASKRVCGAWNEELGEVCTQEFEIVRKNEVQVADISDNKSWKRVSGVYYSKHQKEGKPPSLRVSYMVGFKEFSEWICLQHEGYAQQKAQQWWLQRVKSLAYVPKTIDDALEMAPNHLKIPSHIRVENENGFMKVKGVKFE